MWVNLAPQWMLRLSPFGIGCSGTASEWGTLLNYFRALIGLSNSESSTCCGWAGPALLIVAALLITHKYLAAGERQACLSVLPAWRSHCFCGLLALRLSGFYLASFPRPIDHAMAAVARAMMAAGSPVYPWR